MFADAADIAATVPEDLRPAAFNRALDLILARAGGGPGAAEAEALLRSSPRDRRILGIYGSELLLERSVDVLNFATTRLGMEALTAEQIAALVNERFGIPATGAIVSLALNSAGGLVRTVQRGGATLYRIIAPDPPARRKKSSTKARAKTRAKTTNTQPPPGIVLRDLVALGFFTSARTAADVLLYLEKKGIEMTAQQVAPVLGTLLKAGLLQGEATKNGQRAYRTR